MEQDTLSVSPTTYRIPGTERAHPPRWLVILAVASGLIAACIIGTAWYLGLLAFGNPFGAPPANGTVVGFTAGAFKEADGTAHQGAFLFSTGSKELQSLQPSPGGIVVAAASSPQRGFIAYIIDHINTQTIAVRAGTSDMETVLASAKESLFRQPVWSANEKMLAFASSSKPYTLNPDGTHELGYQATSTAESGMAAKDPHAFVPASAPATYIAAFDGSAWKVRAFAPGVPLAFSPDGRLLLVRAAGSIRAIDPNAPGTYKETTIAIDGPQSAFSPDRAYVAYPAGDSIAIVRIDWNTLSSAPVASIPHPWGRGVAFGAENDLIVASADGSLARYTGITEGKPRSAGSYKLPSVGALFTITEWITAPTP